MTLAAAADGHAELQSRTGETLGTEWGLDESAHAIVDCHDTSGSEAG